MALLKILTAPDPRLKKVAKPVEKVDDSVRQLMDDMLETMYAAPGIGLAATQVGDLRRVIVLDIADSDNGEEPNPIKLANPEVITASEEEATYQEGCLSVPGFSESVERPKAIRVNALDRDGSTIDETVTGLLAVCLQHEMDHLQGKLFVDYLSPLKRQRIRQRLEKEQRRRA